MNPGGSGGGVSLASLVNQFVDLINVAIPVLGGFALLLFLLSVVRYIQKSGDAHGKSEEQKAMLWGLVALFVLFSVWGILRIFKEVIPDYDPRGGGGGGGTERNLN